MANSYSKKDIRLLNLLGLVLGIQPEGVQEGGFTRLSNTKIYREGALGLRDARELFAGLKTTDLAGRALWFNYITRYDSEYMLGFHGTSLNAWRWKIPDPAFAGETSTPGVESSVAFNNFLPEASLPTTVSVLPNERSIPVTYFSKPGLTQMWKLVTEGAPSSAETPVQTGGLDPLPSSGNETQFNGATYDGTLVAPPSSGGLRVFKWGINAPAGRPTVQVQDGTGGSQDIEGSLNSSVSGAKAYDWIYTYVNLATGHEGNPSAGLEATITVTSKAVLISCPIDTGGDDQIGAIRIYRAGGSFTTAAGLGYQRVAEVSLSDNTYVITGERGTIVEYLDKKSDAELNFAPQVKFDNYIPFVSQNQAGDAVWNAVCPFIFGPFADRIVLGLGEKNQPGNVFWTNPGRADSSKAENNVQVTSARDPLVSGIIFNGQPFVASRGDWYALDFQAGSGGVAIFTPRKTQAGKGPIGPWSVAAGPMIFFVTPEGIMQTDGQGHAEAISGDIRPIFFAEDVGEYKAIDFNAAQELFRLYWADPDLHFLYPDTTGEMQQLIFDGDKWRSEEFARPGITDAYTSEPWDNDLLMHATCVYDDIAWPSRSVFLGTDNRAMFRQRPFASEGVETAQFIYGGVGNQPYTDLSTAGWVVGQFRTHTDEYGYPAMLKEIGDVSFEARVKGAAVTQAIWAGFGTGTLAEILRGKASLTLYANSQTGTSTIDDDEQPSDATTGQPIGSSIYNAANTNRQRFPFKVPDDYVYSTAWDYRFYGPWEFNNMTVFWRQDTEVINHWHMDNLNNNVKGWQHVRDGYLDARLYGATTLTLEVDGDANKTQTVVLTPTWTRPDGSGADFTGERYKYYFSFDPVKGKKFTWTLDCTEGMRLYSAGSEVNGKQWITGGGYQNLNPWARGAE